MRRMAYSRLEWSSANGLQMTDDDFVEFGGLFQAGRAAHPQYYAAPSRRPRGPSSYPTRERLDSR
jgi:hypothetical protein